MGEGEFGSVGRSVPSEERVREGGKRRRGGEAGTVTQFNPRLLAMKSDEKQNRRMRQNERTERPREERPRATRRQIRRRRCGVSSKIMFRVLAASLEITHGTAARARGKWGKALARPPGTQEEPGKASHAIGRSMPACGRRAGTHQSGHSAVLEPTRQFG